MIDYATEDRHFSTPGGNGVLFRYRNGTNDYSTLLASLDEDEYGLRGVEIAGTALDLGGYLGSVGIGIAIDHPSVRVVIVEPVPENLELIAFAVRENRVTERVTIIAGAIGDGSEVSVGFRYTGSELATHHAFVGNMSIAGDAPHDTITYRSLTPRDLGPADFVKTDTEGGEWAFLASDSNMYPLIVGEWHPGAGRSQETFTALLAHHEVTFTGPVDGPGGFRAVLR